MQRMIVLGIVLLAFVVRLVGLSNHPGGFTPDEASFGYDAYSILKTGKDQWGNTFPLTFKSFGDYKLPVYTYIAIPSVALFGLNEAAVRLPNAILGSLAVLATYLLAFEFCHEDKSKQKIVPLFAALFLALSYWHITLSRGAFEANLTTFFMTAGVWLFLKARKKKWLIFLSMFLFGFNLFTYHASRLVTPVVVVTLMWIYRDAFPKGKAHLLAKFIFVGFFVASALSLVSGSGIRAATATIFSQNLGSGVIRASVVNAGMPLVLGKALYNEPSFKFSKIVSNYISYFSPQFLITEGAREASYGMIPGVGLITVVEFTGLLFFVWILTKQKSKYLLLLSIWILVAPFPAAVSVGPGGAANRAAILMPALEIAASFGVYYAVNLLKKKWQFMSYSFLILLTCILGLFAYTKYIYEQPVYASNGMMYGMSSLFEYLNEYPTKKIIISRALSEPHMYAAFYDQIDPSLYQQATINWNFQKKGLNWVDQQEGYSVGRYTIGSIDKIRDFQFDNTYVVGSPEDMPLKVHIVKTIYSADQKPLWVVAEKP